MKHGKSALIFLFLSLFLITKLSAKETQLAKDTKTALEKYAGMSELQKRGFKLESLDKAENMEDVYDALLPYMIQDGAPLDNAISFKQSGAYDTYNFKQHYTVHFTDDYGTKDELKKRGYKENEIFAYFSKGKEVYRGGHFSWEKAKYYPEIYQNNQPTLPPVVSEKFIYFMPLYWTEQFYPDYWKQAASKDFIIFDLRLDQGGEWPIAQFFDYLEQNAFKGELIIIIDASSATGENLLSYRMTKWLNGKESPRFKYTAIGENTIGNQNFSGEWKRFETERNIFWGVRSEINKWKKYDEGVGAMPDIWAENSEDILKTLQYLTGINDFGKYVAAYNNYIANKEDSYLTIPLPQELYNIKNDNQLLEAFSKFSDVQNLLYKQCSDSKLKQQVLEDAFNYSDFDKLTDASKSLSLNQYCDLLKSILNEIILDNGKKVSIWNKTVIDLEVLYSKGADHKLSEKEIAQLYDKLEMKFVDIPGKNIKMLNTEVTQKLYETIMGFNPSEVHELYGPVTNVSGYAMMFFCNKLSEKFGFTPVYSVNGETDVSKWDQVPCIGFGFVSNRSITQDMSANGFRLPTKQEWMYAKDGGQNYRFAGSDNLGEVSWYSGNSGGKPHPVGQKKPNGYGLYDMSGNVYEMLWAGSFSSLDFEHIGGSYTGYDSSEYSHEGKSTGNSGGGEYVGFRIVQSQPVQNVTSISGNEVTKELKAMEKSLVTIPGRNIKMLKTEVTQKLYNAVIGDNPSHNRGDNYPVENISFYDAIYFCNKLSQKLGYEPVYAVDGETDISKWNYIPDSYNYIANKTYSRTEKITQNNNAKGFRLPTADEFIYAAQGGQNYLYAGSDNLDEVAWYEKNSGGATHPVAQKKPNGYGLYDMNGNVREWLGNKINENYNRYEGGGAYCNVNRGTYHNLCYDDIGFRIVLSLPEKNKTSYKEKNLNKNDLELTMVEIPQLKISMLNSQVTQDLFETIMGYNPVEFASDRAPYKPVETTWYEAVIFCNKLSKAFGYKPVYEINGKSDVEKWDYTPNHNIILGEIIPNKKADGFRLPTLDEWMLLADEGTIIQYDEDKSVWAWEFSGNDLHYSCGGNAIYGDGETCKVNGKEPRWWAGLRVVRASK